MECIDNNFANYKLFLNTIYLFAAKPQENKHSRKQEHVDFCGLAANISRIL